MSAIAIIPARGGSKRIPRKNIRDFLGRPIIEYSIRAALESGCFDEVMVSTDDDEIAEIAAKAGARVPFRRSPENANDYAGTVEVLLEVIAAYERQGRNFDEVCCLYPTAPFVTAARLNEAMGLLRESRADSVVPVVKFGYPIQRSFRIENDRARMLWPENYAMRSQDLEPAYHDSGQFYCLKISALLAQKRLYTDDTVPVILSETEVQDIDNEDDWKLAELKFQLLHGNERVK